MSNEADDPFGMVDEVSRDMAALEGAVSEAPVDAVKEPAKKLGPGGIPMPAFIGICAFGGLLVLVIIIAVVVKMNSSGGRESAMRAEAQRRLDAEAQAKLAAQSEVAELRSAVQAQQDVVKAMNGRLEKILANQDVQVVEQRVTRTEAEVRKLSNDMAAVVRRVGDSQPFEAEMYMREDLRIVSIGGGIARVVDANGKEFSLHRGDRWGGVRVTSIRADRRQITFSDGSVVTP